MRNLYDMIVALKGDTKDDAMLSAKCVNCNKNVLNLQAQKYPYRSPFVPWANFPGGEADQKHLSGGFHRNVYQSIDQD